MYSLTTKFIEKEIPYTGAELRSHFIYDCFDLLGDAAVAFLGPCRVDLGRMVDLEDVKRKSPIYSEKMVHFLAEFFGMDLSRLVLLQRLWVALVFEELTKRKVGKDLRRIGDDLYDGKEKLSVSIATLTPVSGVIHLGVNISSRNTPVPTRGLQDYGIDPVDFSQAILKAFAFEAESSARATWKVRGVP
ncbi:MAG: DUF366 family protein [bacterium]